MKIIVGILWWCCMANLAMGLYTVICNSLIQKRLVNPGEWGVWRGGRYGWHCLMGSGAIAIVMYYVNIHSWLFS